MKIGIEQELQRLTRAVVREALFRRFGGFGGSVSITQINNISSSSGYTPSAGADLATMTAARGAALAPYFGGGVDGTLTLVADTTMVLGAFVKQYSSVSLGGFTLSQQATNGQIVLLVSGTLAMSGGTIRNNFTVSAGGAVGAGAGGSRGGGAGGASTSNVFVFAKTITGPGTISAAGNNASNAQPGITDHAGQQNGSAGTAGNPASLVIFGVGYTGTTAPGGGGAGLGGGGGGAGSVAGTAPTAQGVNDYANALRDTMSMLARCALQVPYTGTSPRFFSSNNGGGGGSGGGNPPAFPGSTGGGGGGGAGGMLPGLAGGTGGAGGGNAGQNSTSGGSCGGGGGGGGSGCIAVVVSSAVDANVTITAAGGNGGNGGQAGMGTGAGGIVYYVGPSGPSISVAAGTGGTAGACTTGGTNGTAGAAGSVGLNMAMYV